MTAELKPNSVPVFWRPRKSLNEPVPALRTPPPNTAPLMTAVDPWVRRSTSSKPSADRSVICARVTVGSFNSLSKIASPLVSTRIAMSNLLINRVSGCPFACMDAQQDSPAKNSNMFGLLADSGAGPAKCRKPSMSECEPVSLTKWLPFKRLHAKGLFCQPQI